MYYRSIGVGGAAVAACAYGNYQVQKMYPPSGRIYNMGELVTVDGETKKVVGYFGASDKVLDEGIDTNREIYYGRKKTAQAYAESRAGTHSKPQTVLLVAGKTPGSCDHLPQRYEGPHEPLAPSYSKRENLKAVHREDVTPENRVGTIASIKRMVKELTE